MQEHPETQHEGNDLKEDHEEALHRVLRESEKQRNSRYYKAQKYFSKWENIVSTLTLFFIMIYTGVTAIIMFASVETAQHAKVAADAAVEATKISKDIMLVNHRANLVHGIIELNGFIPIKGSVPENYAEIRVDITNSGHAQAIIRSNGVSYVNLPSEASEIPDNAPCGPPSSSVLNAPINGTRITETQATYLIVVPRVLNTQGKSAIPSSHGYVLGFIEYDDGYSLRGDANPVPEYFCGRFEEPDKVAPGRTYHPIRDCAAICKKD
jgi:hypothetical protein